MPGTVQVVDSDATNLKLAASILRQEGFTVVVSSTGEQALTALQTSRVDLILASVTLPGMNGFDLVMRLKANPRTAPIRVIALLQAENPDTVRNAFGAGCEGYLVKPLDPVRLATVVRELLNPAAVDTLQKSLEKVSLPESPAPAGIAAALRRRHIALVGLSDRDTDLLCGALAAVGAFPRVFDPNETPDSGAVSDCSVILLQVDSAVAGSPWLRPEAIEGRRVVLVGQGADLISLDAALQAQVRDFLVDRWQPEEVLVRLGLILGRSESAPGPRAAGGASATTERKGSREVLIVDDDLSIRALIGTLLQRRGLACLFAVHAEEGLEILKERRPGVVILDVNLPGMSGFEALPKMRAMAPEVKVLMLTGNGHEADVVQGLQLGAADYVSKPFQPNELAARVARLLP